MSVCFRCKKWTLICILGSLLYLPSTQINISLSTGNWVMVGYDPQIQELSKFEHGVAGATSGIITRMIAQPLDVIKIRFQVGFFFLLNIPHTITTRNCPPPSPRHHTWNTPLPMFIVTELVVGGTPFLSDRGFAAVLDPVWTNPTLNSYAFHWKK